MTAAERGSSEWLQAPPEQAMTVSEWQYSLKEEFSSEGIIGPSLLPVFEAERRFGDLVDQKTFGHLHLREGFESFLHDTIGLADRARRNAGRLAPEWHGVLLLEFASLFRVFRAADVLFHSGYPLDGLSLLRDVRDRALYIGAVGRGAYTVRDLEGIAAPDSTRSGAEDSLKSVRRRREQIERDITKRSVGAESGLPEPVVKELRRWTQLFHMEVHGSRLSRATEFRDFYATGAPLDLRPAWRELPMTMFINRFTEVAWLVNRCLPLLQLYPRAFDSSWQRKWKTMDDALREDVASLWRMNKPISGAITLLVEVHFAFSPDDCYRE